MLGASILNEFFESMAHLKANICKIVSREQKFKILRFSFENCSIRDIYLLLSYATQLFGTNQIKTIRNNQNYKNLLWIREIHRKLLFFEWKLSKMDLETSFCFDWKDLFWFWNGQTAWFHHNWENTKNSILTVKRSFFLNLIYEYKSYKC